MHTCMHIQSDCLHVSWLNKSALYIKHSITHTCAHIHTHPHVYIQELEELFVSYPEEQERIISNLLSSHNLDSNGNEMGGKIHRVYPTSINMCMRVSP
jgi:hypothetical protein